jgi:nucleoside-diphosphate-sugar epimerase
VETVNLDASDAGKLQKACRDASVLYFCASPPYGSPELLVPLVQGVTQGVARAGCRLVYADNLYAYGRASGPVREGLPHRPLGPKGRARAAAVDHVLEAHRLERIGADVVCASDFYGPGVTCSLLGDRVFRPAIDGGTINLLGDADAPHSYTYIEDFARALVVIAGEAGSFGLIWHVPEAETLTTRDLTERIITAAGGKASCRITPKWLETVMGVFYRPIRELRETAFQRNEPWVVEAKRLQERFGFQPTPIEEAVAATVDWYRLRSDRKAEGTDHGG